METDNRKCSTNLRMKWRHFTPTVIFLYSKFVILAATTIRHHLHLCMTRLLTSVLRAYCSAGSGLIVWVRWILFWIIPPHSSSKHRFNLKTSPCRSQKITSKIFFVSNWSWTVFIAIGYRLSICLRKCLFLVKGKLFVLKLGDLSRWM
jgi:hypothetical protein